MRATDVKNLSYCYFKLYELTGNLLFLTASVRIARTHQPLNLPKLDMYEDDLSL